MRKTNSQQGFSQIPKRIIRAKRMVSSSVQNEFNPTLHRQVNSGQLYNQPQNQFNIYKNKFEYSNANEISQKRQNEKYSVPVQRKYQSQKGDMNRRFQDHKFNDIYSSSIQNNRRILHSEICEEQEPCDDAKSVGGVSYRSTSYINGLKVKVRQRSSSKTKSVFKTYNEDKEHFVFDHEPQPLNVENEYNLEEKQQFHPSQNQKQEPLFNTTQQQDKPSLKVTGFQFSFGVNQKNLKNIPHNLTSQPTDHQQWSSQKEQPKNQDVGSWSTNKRQYNTQAQPSRQLFQEEEQVEDDVQTINLGFGKYEGQIYDDAMNGQGILYDQDGEVIYQGGFKDGEFDGYGILINTDDNQQEGTSNYRDLSCDQNSWTKYEGMLKESQKNGVGYLHFKNGDCFVGEFENDKANGLGVYKSKEHKVFGIWLDDHYKKGLD